MCDILSDCILIVFVVIFEA